MMKTYNKIFLISVGLLLLVCGTITWWAQPINNDLTRIGAYPERWFGWNAPQQNRPAHATWASPSSTHKILVIGDSFSEAGSWQSYFGEHYSFSFAHIRRIRFDELVQKINQEHPDAVVLEDIERDMADIYGANGRFVSSSPNCSFPSIVDTTNKPLTPPQLTAALHGLPSFAKMTRPLHPSSFSSMFEGFYYLKMWSRILLDPTHRAAKILALNTAQLFSNSRSSQLLVLSGDALLNNTLKQEDVLAVSCSMQKASAEFTKLKLPYVILVVPDKSTAYQPYLVDLSLRNKTAFIDQVHVDHLPHGINMLPVIRTQIQQGQQDFYLPNDTHWGYKGYQLAAELIEHELSSQWYHPQ